MDRRVTKPLLKVAVAIMTHDGDRFYGYPLSKTAAVRSGVLYPMLDRMLEDGWLQDDWELPQDGPQRPRRYYTLTDLGRRELGGLAAHATSCGWSPQVAWGAW